MKDPTEMMYNEKPELSDEELEEMERRIEDEEKRQAEEEILAYIQYVKDSKDNAIKYVENVLSICYDERLITLKESLNIPVTRDNFNLFGDILNDVIFKAESIAKQNSKKKLRESKLKRILK